MQTTTYSSPPAFADLLGEIDGWTPEPRREQCEGVGEIGVRVYYPAPASSIAAAPKPMHSRLVRTLRLDAYYTLRRLALRGPKNARAPADRQNNR